MKTLITILILLIICSSCTSWTKEQVILQSTATTLAIADWGTTLDIVDNPEYYETNLILGDHPTRKEVNKYFTCLIGSQILITHLLPSKYRNWWLNSNILISGYMVYNNYNIGLRINF